MKSIVGCSQVYKDCIVGQYSSQTNQEVVVLLDDLEVVQSIHQTLLCIEHFEGSSVVCMQKQYVDLVEFLSTFHVVCC